MKLPRNRILLFFMETGGITQKHLAWYRSMLTPGEIRKAERFRLTEDHNLSLASRAMVRYLISQFTGRAPETQSFFTNDYGKLFLDPTSPSTKVLDLYFNVSHCKGAVVCGFCRNHDIGVDMEGLDRRVDLDVADRFFSPAEAARIRSRTGTGQRKAAFLDIWTLKEAYIKARGKGLSIPLDSFSFEWDPGGTGFSLRGGDEHPEHWQFFRWYPGAGKRVAAAVCSSQHLTVEKQVLDYRFNRLF